MIPNLPSDSAWFSTQTLDGDIWCLSEPHVTRFMQSNIWFLRGTTADLLVDAGNGIAPLRPALPAHDPARLIVVATHAHADHVGGMAEFPGIWCNANAVRALETADPAETLAGPGYGLEDVSGLIVPPPGLSGPLAAARPHGFDPARFGPRPCTVGRALREGDVVDLGNRRFSVLEVPGHSPACIALYDPDAELLIAGDAIYDGGLVDGLFHSDRAAYRRSLERLRDLPVDRVLGGHGPAMTGVRMARLIRDHLAG